MSSLAHGNTDPSAALSLRARIDELKAAPTKREATAILEKHARWQAFMRSPVGEVARALAQPEIVYVDYLQALPDSDFMRKLEISEGLIEKKRAELRGERRVWVRLLVEFEALQKRLSELKEQGFKEEGGWQSEKKAVDSV